MCNSDPRVCCLNARTCTLTRHLLLFVVFSFCLSLCLSVALSLCRSFLISVLYIDMEGRSDDQSMQIMIEQMGPKRIAFVHGNETAVAALSTSLSTPIEIYMTKQNETISMKSDTKTYSIKMDDSCKWCTVFLLCGCPLFNSLPCLFCFVGSHLDFCFLFFVCQFNSLRSVAFVENGKGQ